VIARHLIFDLDGTLIDSAPSILAGFALTLESRGIKPKVPLDNRLIGPPLMEALKKASGIEQDALIEELARDFKTDYDEVGYKETLEYPGITGALKALLAGGVSLYIVTNKRIEPTRKIICLLGWGDVFTGVYSPDSLNTPPRSKSDVICYSMQHHGMNPQETVYVGDREDDIEAAEKSGIGFIGVTWGYSVSDFEAPRKLYAVKELAGVIN
jgi:phosphoglycolate phosphatase